MSTPRRFILLLLLSYLLPGLAHAGELTLRFLDLRAEKERSDLFLETPGKIIHLESKGLNLTPPLVLKQGLPRIGIAKAQEEFRKNAAARQVVEAKFGEGWSRSLVLIGPDPKFPLSFTAICLNASPEAFPAGSIYFANLTQGRIEARLGSETLHIEANKTTIVSPPKTEDGDYPVRIHHQASGDKKLRPLVMGTWRREPSTRQLVFAVEDSAAGRPRIISLPDDPAEPPMPNP